MVEAGLGTGNDRQGHNPDRVVNGPRAGVSVRRITAICHCARALTYIARLLSPGNTVAKSMTMAFPWVVAYPKISTPIP